jgi:hypothetical protein
MSYRQLVNLLGGMRDRLQVMVRCCCACAYAARAPPLAIGLDATTASGPAEAAEWAATGSCPDGMGLWMGTDSIGVPRLAIGLSASTDLPSAAAGR